MKKHIILFLLYITILTLYILQLQYDNYIYVEWPIYKLGNMLLNVAVTYKGIGENEVKIENLIERIDIENIIYEAFLNNNLSRNDVNNNREKFQNTDRTELIRNNVIIRAKKNLATQIKNELKKQLDDIKIILKIGLYSSCIDLSKKIDIRTVLNNKSNVLNELDELNELGDINNFINDIQEKINGVIGYLTCYVYEDLEDNKLIPEEITSEISKYSKHISNGLLAVTISIGILVVLMLARIFYKNTWLRLLYRIISIITMLILIVLTLVFLLIPHVPIKNIKEKLREYEIDILEGNYLQNKYWGISLKLLISVTVLFIITKLLPIKL